MKEIKRDQYLKQLLSCRWDGQIKVITGIRRCGKSYLLGKIYKNYLLQDGVKKSNIISIQLDLIKDIRFRNPLELSSFIPKKIGNKDKKFYLFIDEIQMSDEVPNPYSPEGKNITFYGLIRTKLYDTTLTSIALSVFVTNLFKIQARILFALIWILGLIAYQPADFEPETV